MDLETFVDSIVKPILEQDEYEYVGVRFCDDTYVVGQRVYDVSRRWDDGEPTEELLEGLSAIDATLRKLAKLCREYWWCGDYVYVLGANHALCGEDPGELVMQEPVVLWAAPKSEILDPQM